MSLDRQSTFTHAKPLTVYLNTIPPSRSCEPDWRSSGYIVRIWPDRAEISPQEAVPNPEIGQVFGAPAI
jgi:hypothetical protein